MDTNVKQFCDVAGHRLAYQRGGYGKPVLLVHGITTYSFIWRNLIPILSSRYQVIAMDLLGCGDSDKPLNEPYSLKRHAELLHAFVDQLDISRFHFVGHDVGGGIGQIFAVHHPERLFDLVLINSVAHDFWPVQPISAMRAPIVRHLIMATLDLGILRQIVLRGVYHKTVVDDELMELFSQPMHSSDGRKAFLHFARSLDNRDLIEIEAGLQNLNLPVLIVRGEADEYLSAEISAYLHHQLPNSQLVKIAMGGHYIQEDEPVQIAESMMNFFEERPHG